MYETILFSIAMTFVGLILLLAFLCTLREFLTWAAGKYDPIWAKEFDKYQSEYFRFKNTGENTDWGV